MFDVAVVVAATAVLTVVVVVVVVGVMTVVTVNRGDGGIYSWVKNVNCYRKTLHTNKPFSRDRYIYI